MVLDRIKKVNDIKQLNEEELADIRTITDGPKRKENL